MTLLEDSILDVRMCDTNKRVLLGHLFLRLSGQFNPPKWQWRASRAPCSLRIFDDWKNVSIKTQGSLYITNANNALLYSKSLKLVIQ